jgi:hypothetical protein
MQIRMQLQNAKHSAAMNRTPTGVGSASYQGPFAPHTSSCPNQ